MAKDYFQSKEFKEILKSYESKKDKGESLYLDADDFADIADYYLNIDQPLSALEAIDMGLAVHPDEEVLLIVLSATFIYERRYDKAENVLNKLDAGNSDVKYQIAQLQYAKYGDLEKAEKTWREWMEMNNGGRSTEQQQRENYIHIISSLAELRDVDDEISGKEDELSMKAVRKWVREYIDRFQPLGKYDEDVQLTDICRESNMADLMSEMLTQILEEQPYLPKGWSNLALAQFIQKNYVQALDSCAFALAINPNDVEALLTKAHTLNAMGEKSASKPVFKEYLDKGGEAIQAIPYAEALFMDGEKDAAVDELKWLSRYFDEKRLDTNKRWKEAQEHAAENPAVFQETGEMYEAFYDLYTKIHTDISDLYHHNGYYKESIAANQKILNVDSKNSEAYFMIGINNLALGRYEEASRNFALALQWAKDQIMMGIDIALTFVLNNFDDFAIEVLNAISEVAENSESPFVKNIPAAKSLTYLKLGQTDQFLQFFKIACQQTPVLVRNVYEGFFPKEMPVSEWGDYAERNMDSMLEDLKNDKLSLRVFSGL